jgi:iron(III) transport system substrate-binding protein
MKGVLPLLALLALLVLGPVLLRHRVDAIAATPDETLVIITPHNEATRYEFGRAFAAAHKAKTGRTVFIDWRTTGGTSEIARYVAAQYLGSFRDYWLNTLHRPWTPADLAFDDPKSTSPDALAARQAFLKSDAGCGIDLFFGGGSFDHIQMANAGRLVDSGALAAHPELFSLSGSSSKQASPTQIPRTLGGEPLWDPKGQWIGACLGAFGICYNSDSLARLGVTQPPANWGDLANPLFADQLAMADPTQSGSVAKAFEMIIQQQIIAAGGNPAEGWQKGMQLIQRISANARYFTGSATEIPFSVQAGDAAAGMCIDFYGRFESQAVEKSDGTSRMVYVTPFGGSSTGADPISMFRGAPHPDLAREFIDFVLSQDGQKLWAFKTGTPGGPEKYALRRIPIRPDLYAHEFAQFESDPYGNPYHYVVGYPSNGEITTQPNGLIYHPEWTASLFGVISFEIKSAYIDPNEELKTAWQALIQAHFPPQATAAFADLSAIDYKQSSTTIRDTLRSPNKLDSIQLARTLTDHFREQYQHATELARKGL